MRHILHKHLTFSQKLEKEFYNRKENPNKQVDKI